MTERDPIDLADAREREADAMAETSARLEADVRQTRDDWERKRADDHVPGAPPPPPETSSEEEQPQSPAPQAPPPSAGPGDAETPPEGSGGPPADVIDERQGRG